jgi:hypothetical protein
MAIYRVDNFSGGLTDLGYEPGKEDAEVLENFNLDEFGKLVRRGGVVPLLQTTSPQLPDASSLISYIFTNPSTIGTSPQYQDVFVSTVGSTSINGKLFRTTRSGGIPSNEYYSAWAEVLGPTGLSLGSGVTKVQKINDLIILTLRNGRCVCMAYIGGVWTFRPTSLPKPVPSSVVKSASGGGETRSAALVRACEFTTDFGVTYLIESEPSFHGPFTNILTLDVDPSLSVAESAITFTGTAALVDDTDKFHYHIAGTKIRPYCTENNATSLLRCVDAGYAEGTTPIYAVVQTINGLGVTTGMGAEIYTDSGQAFNSSLTDIWEVTRTSQDIFWAIDKERGYSFLRQSKPGTPFAWPVEFELQLHEKAFGLSSIGIYPIVLSNGGLYRIEGFLDNSGVGSVTKKEISTTVNPIGERSIINVDGRIFFQAMDGFYVTDGFQVKKISGKIDNFYQGFLYSANTGSTNAGPLLLRASYDAMNKRIYWMNPFSGDLPSKSFVLHLAGNEPHMAFSIVTYPFHPQASADFAFGHLIAGDQAYVYLQNESQEYPSPATFDNNFQSKTYDTLGTNVRSFIPFRYKSSGISLGNEQNAKWVTSAIFVFEKLRSNLSCAILSYNNYADDARSLKPIRERDTVLAKGLRYLRRMFPAGTIRCQTKQIEITNAKVILMSSGNGGYALGNVNGTSNLMVLATTPTIFPNGSTAKATEPVGQWLTLEQDNFVTEYLIIAVSNDTVNVSDPGNTLVTATGQRWRIVGYPRDEFVKLMSYTVDYADIAAGGGDAFRSNTTGEN